MDAKTHYSVLHIAEDAPPEVIRASYKHLIQKFHPDRVAESERDAAVEHSKRINGAYQVLSDPELRAEYDAMLQRLHGEPHVAHPPPTGAPPPQANRKPFKNPQPSTSHRPWARYWARTFDLLCAVPFLAIGVAIILPAMDDAGYTPLSVTFWLFLVALPISIGGIEALALSTFGTTPGKKLLGIRVTGEDGNLLSFAVAFKRSLFAQLAGFAWNVPGVSGLTALYAYQQLTTTGSTVWDRGAKSAVVHERVGFVRYAAVVGFCMVLVGTLKILGETSPNTYPPETSNSSVFAQGNQPPSPVPAPPQGINVQPPTVTVADTYLSLSAQELNDEQFAAGANRWLEQYPQHANQQDIEIIQGHLRNVLTQYPQIELRAALVMALQRAYRAGEEQENQTPVPRQDPSPTASAGDAANAALAAAEAAEQAADAAEAAASRAESY